MMTPSLLAAPDLELKSYCEDRDFQAQGKPEPNSRSQTLIYHLQDKKWLITVTFQGTLYSSYHDVEQKQIKTKRERQKEYQDFVTLIEFRSLALLDDTVTEVILNDPKSTKTITLHHGLEETNRFANLIKNLRFYHIRENPLRVTYPPRLQFPSFRAIESTELPVTEEDEISDGVFRVIHPSDKTPHILKVVNRPLYIPRNSEVIRQELENLEHFKGVPGIIQAAGIAVMSNPYATTAGVQQMVVSGILTEYHSSGSLQCVLNEKRIEEFSWERWAGQIGNALNAMHCAKKTHMDVKPSNVVLDDDGNAVLIDISGIGGITHQWCAPEIWDEMDGISPFDLPFRTRQLNDTWAYGKLLAEIASNVGDSPFAGTLRWVADHLTEEDIHMRWTISEGISRLNSVENALVH